MDIEKPPLKRVIFRILQDEQPTFSFDIIKKLEENLNEMGFIMEFNLRLPRAGHIVSIQANPSPLIFRKNKKMLVFLENEIQLIIEKDEYEDYTNYKEFIKSLINLMIKLKMLTSIKRINLTYDNQFNWLKKNFKLNNYFNIFSNIPDGVKIDYTDFTLGFLIDDDFLDKFIIRILSRPKDSFEIKKENSIKEQENLLYFLLQFNAFKDLNLDIKKDERKHNGNNNILNTILEKLDRMHEIIEKNFKTIITQKLKDEIGLKL